MPVLHRATNAHTMYMRARMYNPVTLPALTAARRSPLYLRGVRQRKGVLPPVDRCWQLCRTTRRAETEEGLTPKIARIQYFCFRIVPDWSEGQISLGTPDLKTPCIPHSWLGLGRNGHHHGVARGQVSRTDSGLKRKNGNRYVLFLEHRYAVTHSLKPLVRLSRAVTGYKNHPPSSQLGSETAAW